MMFEKVQTMKVTTEMVRMAIEFALNNPKVKKQILALEAPPNRFTINEIAAKVINYKNSIIRVFINFHEKGNPNNFKEDMQVDIQGSNFSDFKILHLIAYQSSP